VSRRPCSGLRPPPVAGKARSSLIALLASCAVGIALAWGCASPSNTKKIVAEECSKNLDCAYGLECVAPEGSAAGADSDAAIVQGRRTCQYKSFGECDTPPDADGGGVPAAAQTSGQQCLPGYRCRDGRCTVMCAANKDCRDGEACRIGVCQRTGGRAAAMCYDNRDCPWPETCFYGQCVMSAQGGRCQSDLDCQANFHCVNGLCQ
jgi:hypothetical protein